MQKSVIEKVIEDKKAISKCIREGGDLKALADERGIKFATPVKLDEKCNLGWGNGECCCNCQNQIELFKHPWNKTYEGNIDESTGLYACIVPFDCEHIRKGIIFDRQHGYCELYVRYKNNN